MIEESQEVKQDEPKKKITATQKFLIGVLVACILLSLLVIGYKLGLRGCNGAWLNACSREVLNMCSF